MNSEFPIMGSPHLGLKPTTIPWGVIAPFEKRAQRNHGQSLSHLAARGGLSHSEAVAVMEDRGWYSMGQDAETRLKELVEQKP